MSSSARSALMPVSSSFVLLAVIIILSVVNKSSAVTPFNRYVIKGRTVELSEGLTILRRFLLPSSSDNERCQKYSVLLYTYYKYENLDQFRIAEIGVASPEKTVEEYRKVLGDIQRDTLRDLFKEAIKTEASKEHLDASLVELVDCLTKKFGTNDVRARSFLNNRDLQNTLNQYKSIMNQNMNFLLDDSAKHPHLTFEQLAPNVRKTIVDLFNGDKNRAEFRFIQSTVPTFSQTSIPVVTEAAKLVSEPPSTTMVPTVAPELVAPVTSVTPVILPSAPLGPARPPVEPVEKHPLLSGEEITNQLPEENRQLLNKAIFLLDLLYKTLPLESKLNDRCQAYSEVITSEPANLNEKLVKGIVQKVDQRIKAHGPTEEKFIPEANVRDNFLFTISAFPKDGKPMISYGDETWMDLVDCVSQWELIDEQVRAFMNNPQHYYEELLASSAH